MHPQNQRKGRAWSLLGAGLLTAGLIAACGSDLLTIDVTALLNDPNAAASMGEMTNMPVGLQGAFASTSQYLDPAVTPPANCPTVTRDASVANTYTVTSYYDPANTCTSGSDSLTGTVTLTVTGASANGVNNVDPLTMTGGGTATMTMTDYVVVDVSGNARTYNGDITFSYDPGTDTLTLASTSISMVVDNGAGSVITHTLEGLNLTITGYTGATPSMSGGFTYVNSLVGSVVVSGGGTIDTCGISNGNLTLDAGLLAFSVATDGTCGGTIDIPGYGTTTF